MPKIHLHWEVSTVLEGLRAARLPAARTQPAGNPKCNTARPAGARARRRSDRLTTLFAALNESVAVQVFGRRHDEPFHALWRPASKKRQGTKSREVGHRRCRGR